MGRTDRVVEVYRFLTPHDHRLRATTVDSSIEGEGPWHVLTPELSAAGPDAEAGASVSAGKADNGNHDGLRQDQNTQGKGFSYAEAPTPVRARGLEACLLRTFHLENQVRLAPNRLPDGVGAKP